MMIKLLMVAPSIYHNPLVSFKFVFVRSSLVVPRRPTKGRDKNIRNSLVYIKKKTGEEIFAGSLVETIVYKSSQGRCERSNDGASIFPSVMRTKSYQET